MIGNARRIGRDVLGPQLQRLKERHRSIGEIRGLGVFWAIELVANPESREPLSPYGTSNAAINSVVAECKATGLLPSQTSTESTPYHHAR